MGLVACIVTLGILLFGIRGFGTGLMSGRQQNKVMRWRIIAQFAAVIIMVLGVLIMKEG